LNCGLLGVNTWIKYQREERPGCCASACQQHAYILEFAGVDGKGLERVAGNQDVTNQRVDDVITVPIAQHADNVGFCQFPHLGQVVRFAMLQDNVVS
jgi:hypothetical protein